MMRESFPHLQTAGLYGVSKSETDACSELARLPKSTFPSSVHSRDSISTCSHTAHLASVAGPVKLTAETHDCLIRTPRLLLLLVPPILLATKPHPSDHEACGLSTDFYCSLSQGWYEHRDVFHQLSPLLPTMAPQLRGGGA